MGIFLSILFISLELNKIRSQEAATYIEQSLFDFSPNLFHIFPARTSYQRVVRLLHVPCNDKNMTVVAHSAILIVSRDNR